MKIRWLSLRNSAVSAWIRNPFLTVMLSLGGMALFVGVLTGFLVFFQFTGEGVLLRESIYSVFYFLLLFLLAGAVPFVATTILQSADYALLFNAPVPPRTVIAAKLLDATVTNSLQFMLLGVPAMVATSLTLHLPLLGWILLPALVMLFALLPALLTAIALLILLALMGIARLRGILILLNGFMALIVCVTIVLETNHLPRFREFGRYLLSQSAPAVSASPAAHFAPSGWFADVFLELSRGQYASALLTIGWISLLCVALFGVCIQMGAKLLTASSITEDTSSGRISSNGNEGLNPFPGNAVVALMRKDFRYLRRDAMLLSQLVMPVLLYFVPYLLGKASPDLKPQEELFPLTLTMVGTILFMQTSILSLSSMGLEGRSFWIALTSPNSTLQLLKAKWGMSAIFTIITAVSLTSFAAIMYHAELRLTLAILFIIIGACAALCGLGVGISAAFPRFVYENPAHRVSFWALTLGFVISVGYLFIVSAIFLSTWYLSLRLTTPSSLKLLWSAAFIGFASLSFLCIVIPLSLGSKRLANYPWEH